MTQILVKENNHSGFHADIEMSSPLYSLKYCSGSSLLCTPGTCCLSAAFPQVNLLPDLQIPTWANHSSSFPKDSISSSPFRLWQCSAFTRELQNSCPRWQPVPTPLSLELCIPPCSTILQSLQIFFHCLRYFSVSHSTGVVAMRYLPLGEGCQRTQSWDCNRLLSPLTEWAPTSTFKIKFSVLAHDQQGLSSTAFPAKCNTIIHASTPTAGLVACNTGSVRPLWQAAEFEFWPIKSLIFT